MLKFRVMVSGAVLAFTLVAMGQSDVRVKAAVAPLYPPIAVATRIGGDVVVRVVIGRDGTVLDAEAVSGSKWLQESAISAAKKWKFEEADQATTNRSFLVKFSYALLSDDDKEDSETMFLPPDSVVLKHRPAKQFPNYGKQPTDASHQQDVTNKPFTNTLLHESGHADQPKPQ